MRRIRTMAKEAGRQTVQFFCNATEVAYRRFGTPASQPRSDTIIPKVLYHPRVRQLRTQMLLVDGIAGRLVAWRISHHCFWPACRRSSRHSPDALDNYTCEKHVLLVVSPVLCGSYIQLPLQQHSANWWMCVYFPGPVPRHATAAAVSSFTLTWPTPANTAPAHAATLGALSRLPRPFKGVQRASNQPSMRFPRPIRAPITRALHTFRTPSTHLFT